MALSNMRNEPRREITEQALGAIALVLVVGGDYALSSWLVGSFGSSGKPHVWHTIFLMFILPGALGVAWFLFYARPPGLHRDYDIPWRSPRGRTMCRPRSVGAW
jgi:apolipoprotein N-acyltransferase